MPQASTKLVHICSTSRLPNTTLMWEGPSRPQQPFQRSLSIKKKSSVSPSTFAAACWMETVLSRNTHKGRNSLTQLLLAIWKAKSMFSSLFSVCCNPLPHCDCYLTWLSAPGPWGKREGILCVYEKRWQVSAMFWLVYIHQKEINTTSCVRQL